jgi:hypothetical protein
MPTENMGEAASFDEGGAESGAFDIPGGASSKNIRALLRECEDLPDDIRERLLGSGDECQADRIDGLTSWLSYWE